MLPSFFFYGVGYGKKKCPSFLITHCKHWIDSFKRSDPDSHPKNVFVVMSIKVLVHLCECVGEAWGMCTECVLDESAELQCVFPPFPGGIWFIRDERYLFGISFYLRSNDVEPKKKNHEQETNKWGLSIFPLTSLSGCLIDMAGNANHVNVGSQSTL